MSKVSNPKERDAVNKALGIVVTKLSMQIMEAKKQTSDTEWEKKYQKLQDFNKGLMTRLKAEQDKAKNLEAEGKTLHSTIEEKEKSVAAEKERIDALEVEVAKLRESQKSFKTLEEEASQLRKDIEAHEAKLKQERADKEGLKS